MVRFKFLNGLLVIDILTVLLILIIAFVPNQIARIILGVPFLLFFPGYMLAAALFPRREGLEGIERLALSLVMSAAVSALIGLGLNYTPWGIRLVPVLYSVATFIILMSMLALYRRAGQENNPFISEFTIRMPNWEGRRLEKGLTVVLALAIVGAVAVLGYTTMNLKPGEQFTEFYILGNAGKAADYPTVFYISQGGVTGVSYTAGADKVSGALGRVKLGIINKEKKPVAYTVEIKIDNQSENIFYAGNSLGRLEGIELQHEEKWEQEIAFAPSKAGDNQKLEIMLYKNGEIDEENTLELWVSVREE